MDEQTKKRVYAILRKKYLEEHPICEACKEAPSEIIHHTITRKTHLLDVAVFMACCRPCEQGFHVKSKQPKQPKPPMVPRKARKPRPCCQFNSRTIGPIRSCDGEVQRKNVFKAGALVATYWLCSRHLDMLILGGNTLENVGSDREHRELEAKTFWRRTETGPYRV